MRRQRVPLSGLVVGLGLLGLILGLGKDSQAQQVHRNGFEALKTAWVKSAADVPYQEVAHTISDQGAHDGQRSEYLRLEAKQGTHIYYQYSTGRADVTDELHASVWLKANRPGAQLVARVVLPQERDPNNLEQRLTALIRGEVYTKVGKWQRLEIGRPVGLLKQQQQFLQGQNRRPINISDAYIDTLSLNVYSGPGATEIWIDDLEVGPIQQAPAVAVSRPTSPGPSHAGRRSQLVDFNGNHILVGGKPFFFRGIRHSDTPLRVLRDTGFNTVLFDAANGQKVTDEAADLGFWLVPILKSDANLANPEGVRQSLGRFIESDAVLFHHLGGTLAYEQANHISRTAQLVRAADPSRPLAADVWDGLMPYSRTLQLVCIHRWPLLTTLELPKYREWLQQRRELANRGTFIWTWIQTHLPEWYTHLMYNQSGAAAFNEPIGPQADQIRLLTYTALASGCKGLAFWSDRFLADSHFGRDRLLCLANLNMELEMLEPLLLSADDEPQWIDGKTPEGKVIPEIKAAVLRTSKGLLVLPIWQGRGAQFVPGQAAVGKLALTVPQVPASMQAWEVSPGEVRSLRTERVTGGTKVIVPEFGLTGAIVFTSDTNLIVRFQEQSRSRHQLAAQWTYDQALYEFEKVQKVEEILQTQGHRLPDGAQLLQDAQNRLRAAKQYWDNRLFGEAYREAQRAMRPLRIVMRAQWEQAVKGLDTPVATPYALSYYSLPRHWEMMAQVARSTPAANVLPGGDFEIIPERSQDAWRPEEPTLDEVELTAVRVGEINRALTGTANLPSITESPQQGKQCLMLQVRPRNPQRPPAALERTLLALNSPPVRLEPGLLVQISGWIRIPAPITASPDGALFYDSAGGEPLSVRLTEPTPWKKITFYRRVPASGILYVTLALTGIGTVYFDDVRIEPLGTPAVTPVGVDFSPR